MSRRLLIAVAVVGCAGHAGTPATPTKPSAAVTDEIKRAETAELARQHDVARQRYQQAIASANDPASIDYARHKYAETLISWGELPEARAQLETAVVAKPDDAAAWHDLGLLRHKQGDDPGAIAALVHARTLRADDPRPRIALAALRWKLGDRPGALAEYRELLALDLPDRVRDKVRWAITELTKPAPVLPPAP